MPMHSKAEWTSGGGHVPVVHPSKYQYFPLRACETWHRPKWCNRRTGYWLAYTSPIDVVAVHAPKLWHSNRLFLLSPYAFFNILLITFYPVLSFHFLYIEHVINISWISGFRTTSGAAVPHTQPCTHANKKYDRAWKFTTTQKLTNSHNMQCYQTHFASFIAFLVSVHVLVVFYCVCFCLFPAFGIRLLRNCSPI